ncbi:AMP-binding protein [Burkholderia pseudomallei]|uniref:AMP-binding protein n=1 Tax=Burkholderia pseudomallei TaxID=28450 RepID=UPI000A1A13B8|nr:AMP-binding protein [Burkholderia pseudomallei]ARK86468.1 long-chain fatty acid--CoA ligase [Burkholderia pseudomallei]
MTHSNRSEDAGARPWERSYPPALRGYRLDESHVPASLAGLAAEACAAYGTKTAFIVVLPNGLSASLSFADVDRYADDFAAYLSGVLGLATGDTLAIQLPNSLHYPIAAFGAWKAGLVVTNVNPLYTERELREQLQDSSAKVLVAHSLSLDVAARVAAECGVRVIVAGLWEFFPPAVSAAIRARLTVDMGGGGSIDAHPSFENVLAEGRRRSDRGDQRAHPVALYQYTGGTSGRSKGAVLTHRNIGSVLKMTDDFIEAFEAPIGSGDVMLTALPLYHVFAFVINFLIIFRKGALNVLVPNPRPLVNLQPAFEQFQPTWMTGVDTLYAGLMAEPWFQANPPKLRFALAGGTATKPSTAERWSNMVGPIVEGYGMTETSCIVSFNPPGARHRAGSVGLPMPGCDVRVVDAKGHPVAPGTRGELQVRGPHVASGYLNQPGDSAAVFADGWLRTGDVVTMDADGWITIVDRIKDMVLVSGFNVYPNEIEAVIATHPDVLEVAVIGVPDGTTGEAVCAYVVRRHAKLAAEDVIAFCRTELTAYKIPKQIRFVDQLPKSHVGKILRARLRESA